MKPERPTSGPIITLLEADEDSYWLARVATFISHMRQVCSTRLRVAARTTFDVIVPTQKGKQTTDNV